MGDHDGTGEARWPDGRVQARWRGLGCPDRMQFYEVHCLNTEPHYIFPTALRGGLTSH